MSNVQAKHVSRQENAAEVHLEFQDDELAIIQLGNPEERIVFLDQARLASLREALSECKAAKPAGLVITSSRAEMFCSGLDTALLNGTSQDSLDDKFLKSVQDLFCEIAALPFPTVAAISGPCLGAAVELALACRYRLISDHKSTTIGFPEVKLGLIPAFGAAQRLPRLIGLSSSLELILSGRFIGPQQALTIGLVHEVVPFHRLRARALKLAQGERVPSVPRLRAAERFLLHTKLGREWVRRRLRKDLTNSDGLSQPARKAATQTIFCGLAQGEQAGLAAGRAAVHDLLRTPESKALIHVHYVGEAAKALGKSAKRSVEHILSVILGANSSGANLSCLLAKGECSVVMKDSSEEPLSRGMNEVRKLLAGLSDLPETEKSFILNRIGVTTHDTSGISNANWAIEVLAEDAELKRAALNEISTRIAHDAILATTTSTLSVSEIANRIDYPSRVVGFHCFQPALDAPLVEIVRARYTNDKTLAIAASLAAKLGKLPIIVDDTPGFLVNRLAWAYLAEALRLLSEGVTASSIDCAAQNFGMRLGPLQLMDHLGLDYCALIAQALRQHFGPRFEIPDYVEKLLRLGRKGSKTGLGFYTYSGSQIVLSPDLNDTLALPRESERVDERDLLNRLVLSMINEAVRCLDEGVAGKPGTEAAGQIDLASVLGCGFPACRGGILYYAEILGPGAVLEQLAALERTRGERFSPWRGIGIRAGMGNSFYSPC